MRRSEEEFAGGQSKRQVENELDQRRESGDIGERGRKMRKRL